MSTPTPAPGTISRRRLLIGAVALASAAAIGGDTVLGRVHRAAGGPLARLAAGDGPRLSVGHLADVHVGDVGGLPAGGRVVPAAAVPLSSALRPGESAQVRVVGLRGARDATDDTLRGIDLDALLPPPDPSSADPLPFYAWTMRTGTHGGASNATGFVAGVDEDPGLGFTMTVHRHGDDAPSASRSSIVLSASGMQGTAALRPGTYLLAVEPGRWDAPTRLPAADDPAWADLASLIVTVQPAV